jgi:hypothetical protein
MICAGDLAVLAVGRVKVPESALAPWLPLLRKRLRDYNDEDEVHVCSSSAPVRHHRIAVVVPESVFSSGIVSAQGAP